MSSIILPTPHNRITAQRRLATTPLAALPIAIAACTSAPVAPPGTIHARTDTIRLVRHGLMFEHAPAVDRIIAFGPESGPNLIYTRNMELPVVVDPDHRDYDKYTFRGGLYTWIAPQNAWVGPDGQSRDWPPDPAMDRGPATRIGRTLGSITTITPVSRLGLRQRKTFELTPHGAEFTYELLNTSTEPISVSAWINTAVTTQDRIALYMPEGTELRGWDDDAIARIESILSPPTLRGWRILDLPRANWRGGTKVWVNAPGGEATIAIWRHNRWLIRAMDAADPDGTLGAAGEGPVAVYIDPTDNLIEAELYAPIIPIPPAAISTAIERWTLLPAEFRNPSPDDLAP